MVCGWALIPSLEVGANSRLGAYSNKYGNQWSVHSSYPYLIGAFTVRVTAKVHCCCCFGTLHRLTDMLQFPGDLSGLWQ